MKTLGYYNGTVAELNRVSVPMLDRAFYFGDGVYDVTYSRNHRIFALEEHIGNCFRSAERVGIAPPLAPSELASLLSDLVCRMDTGENWVYFQFSRGTAPRAHAFPNDSSANLCVMIRPGSVRDPYRPMRCISRPDKRHFLCNVKSLNLLANVLAAEEAARAGADECVLHRNGIVTECAHSNVSILKNGTLFSHPADEQIYAGTGRAHLLALCRKVGICVEERPYTLDELKTADEAIVTSASVFCAPIKELDGIPIGGRSPDVIRAMQDQLWKQFWDQTV